MLNHGVTFNLDSSQLFELYSVVGNVKMQINKSKVGSPAIFETYFSDHKDI